MNSCGCFVVQDMCSDCNKYNSVTELTGAYVLRDRKKHFCSIVATCLSLIYRVESELFGCLPYLGTSRFRAKIKIERKKKKK